YTYPASNYGAYPYVVPAVPMVGSPTQVIPSGYGTPLPIGPAATAAPATLKVVVPAGATVSFDGTASTQTGPAHEFTTPTLSGPEVVTVRAEWAGVKTTIPVQLQPGGSSSIDLTTLK